MTNRALRLGATILGLQGLGPLSRLRRPAQDGQGAGGHIPAGSNGH
jgi:hypothetical protein